MIFVYVLLLQNNKYYIGRTSNPQFRIEEHFNLNGSTWTQKYNPIKLIELINNCDEFDEDKMTLKYISKYGIDNVRGGSFCQEILVEQEKVFIEKMIRNAKDKCFNCGETGHFANECQGNEKERIIPIELQNKYQLKYKNNFRKRYDEYEWNGEGQKLNEHSNEKYSGKINIKSTLSIDEVYLSIYDYYLIIEKIIDNKFDFSEINVQNFRLNHEKINKFLQNYQKEKRNVKDEIDKKIANVLLDFVKNILNIKNKIIKYDACIPSMFDGFFPHTHNANGFEYYINMMSSINEKVFPENPLGVIKWRPAKRL